MNLVLFIAAELPGRLPLADPRAQHILKVLRRSPGDTFQAGLIDGPLGNATLLAADATALTLGFAPSQEPPPLPPITLLIGLPRPQTARDILRDATTLGVARIHFISTERTDPNYASASLWTSGEWQRHLLTGAAQACDTRLPEVTWTHSLASILATLSPPASACRLALDNYEATRPLASALPHTLNSPLILALGPERGWGPADRTALRAANFALCSLGPRVLRLETAVTVALGLALHATGAP
ncbi:MAG: RsmE family RNA methyltransferase [Verrucomicrobia bacterium]|nr:RsmE family RNA methyltransferase [Verrucomicrobiota bacterium]